MFGSIMLFNRVFQGFLPCRAPEPAECFLVADGGVLDNQAVTRERRGS